MAFNISNFSGKINGLGLAKSNLFEMSIVRSPVTLQDTNFALEDLKFLCRSVQVPELQIQTAPYKSSGYGIAVQKPTDFQFSPLTAVFMVDAGFSSLNFFNAWIQTIVNYDLSNGAIGQTRNGLDAHYFAFKDEYVGAAELNIYSGNKEEKVQKYTFTGIYPTSVGGIQPAWENGAEVMTVNVSFVYDYMRVDGISESTPFNPDLSRFLIP